MGENQVINQAGAHDYFQFQQLKERERLGTACGYNEPDYRIFDSHLQVRNACDMLLHMMQDRSNRYRMD